MDFSARKINGSIIGGSNRVRLDNARGYLRAIKEQKLAEKHEKRKEGTFSFDSCVAHLILEVEEFADSVADGNPDVTLKELADVSNMVDILTVLVLGEY